MRKSDFNLFVGRTGLPLALGGLVFLTSASASMIQFGEANFAGTANVAGSNITFTGPPNGITPNTFNTQAPNTGGFAGFNGGSIQNLSGGATTLSKFITFNVTPTLANPTGVVFFDLQGFFPGIGTGVCGGPGVDTIGNSCTPAGSAFTLMQSARNQVQISIGAFGVSYFGTVATGSTVTQGLFTTQNLLPGTISQILAASASGGGTTNSYSATFATVVPEPGSMMLMGLGLAGMATIARKRFINR